MRHTLLPPASPVPLPSTRSITTDQFLALLEEEQLLHGRLHDLHHRLLDLKDTLLMHEQRGHALSAQRTQETISFTRYQFEAVNKKLNLCRTMQGLPLRIGASPSELHNIALIHSPDALED